MRRLVAIVPFLMAVASCGGGDRPGSVPTTVPSSGAVPATDSGADSADGFAVLVQAFEQTDQPSMDLCPFVDREVVLSHAGNLPLLSSLGFQSGVDLWDGGVYYDGPADGDQEQPEVKCVLQVPFGSDAVTELVIGVTTSDVDLSADFVGWWRSLGNDAGGIEVLVAGSGKPVAGCLQEEYLDDPTCLAGAALGDLDVYISSNALSSQDDLRDLLLGLLPEIEVGMGALAASSPNDFVPSAEAAVDDIDDESSAPVTASVDQPGDEYSVDEVVALLNADLSVDIDVDRCGSIFVSVGRVRPRDKLGRVRVCVR